MKKLMLLGVSLLGAAIILTGCGNAQDKAQGEWKHTYKATKYTNHSDNITIKDDNLVLDIKGDELPATKIENPKDDTFKFSYDGDKKRVTFKAKIDTKNDKLKVTQEGEKGSDVFKKVKE